MLLLRGSCSAQKVKIPVRFDPESDPRPGDSTENEVFEILTHHYMRGLTKNSKIFQTLLRQERYHIVSDPLGYWHLTPEFWSGHIMLLTWAIMPDSKSDSSPSFGLCNKNSFVGRWQRWLVKFKLKSVNKLHLLSGWPCERYWDS